MVDKKKLFETKNASHFLKRYKLCIFCLCRGPPFKKLFFVNHFLSGYSFCKFSNLVSLPCPFYGKRGEKEGFPEENLCPFKNVVFVRTQVFGTCPKEKEGTQVFGTCPVEKEGTQVFLRKT